MGNPVVHFEFLAKMREREGTKVMGAKAVPGGPVIGLFRDPEGHVIGLAQKA
ncbi:MAG: hypothetical protein ACXVAO_08990 [Vulcanimicrobiaceae bacterium]